MLLVPSVVPPSLKVTEPVAATGETEAVKVTVTPKVEGLGMAVSETLVGVRFTTWVIAGDEVLPSY
jgi:ribosomal protein S5